MQLLFKSNYMAVRWQVDPPNKITVFIRYRSCRDSNNLWYLCFIGLWKERKCGVLEDLQIQVLGLLYIPDSFSQKRMDASVTNVLDDLTSSENLENMSWKRAALCLPSERGELDPDLYLCIQNLFSAGLGKYDHSSFSPKFMQCGTSARNFYIYAFSSVIYSMYAEDVKL